MGSHHLLIALLHDASSIPAIALTSNSVHLQALRAITKDYITYTSTTQASVDDPVGCSSINSADEELCPQIKLSLEAQHVVEKLSCFEARCLGYRFVGPEHLLLGLLRERECSVAVCVLDTLGVDYIRVRSEVIQMMALYEDIEALDMLDRGTTANTRNRYFRRKKGIAIFPPEGITITPASIDAAIKDANFMSYLHAFATDLTKLARQGMLDPVIGRQSQIERAIQILGRRTKNNPCLVGEAGVGKTAIVEGIAQMIACGADVSQAIAGKRIFSLDIRSLVEVALAPFLHPSVHNNNDNPLTQQKRLALSC
ncbi:hypothetical protein GOP47_0005443 [Adiantum capillus-veneris]|uniref:Clp R domain-containing protein n=1 Tax=Adiantum capillus-veneris TaxID=13818 RepID=A0A9D4V549_ADICA|nr:hypothetical protein GOP47_0005443 [Adiantum capillus-veneris]